MILPFSCKEDLQIQFVFPFKKKKSVEFNQKLSNELLGSSTNCAYATRRPYASQGLSNPDLPQTQADRLINAWINFNVKEVNR